jgi:hypothetical protein
MTISVADLMTDPDLGGTTFMRMRPSVSESNEGTAGVTYATSTLRGIVQPAATADAKLLPEGVRLSDVQAFFCATGVSAGDGASQLPDLLKSDGVTYRVLHVQAFDKHGMTKALAQRLAV